MLVSRKNAEPYAGDRRGQDGGVHGTLDFSQQRPGRLIEGTQLH